jgi:hypothetical protein
MSLDPFDRLVLENQLAIMRAVLCLDREAFPALVLQIDATELALNPSLPLKDST